MNDQEQVTAVRRSAGLALLADRGLVSVAGSDRERWLNGMVSNDVSLLAPGPDHSGCYATVLTPKGRIIADLHILFRDDAYWLETARDAVPTLLERLERYIIADDVELEDISDRYERLALEGPRAIALMEAASGASLDLAPECCADVMAADSALVVAAFGWSGERALQIWAPKGASDALRSTLREGQEDGVPVELGANAIEILRIEAGIPLLGRELDEEVFPDEAGLDRAISTTKGCYTGQEIVARLRSRGHVNHRLVGLRFDSAQPPARDAELFSGERRTGEVTSACVSAAAGTIGLGYVRVDDASPGSELRLAEGGAVVTALPFVGVGSVDPDPQNGDRDST